MENSNEDQHYMQVAIAQAGIAEENDGIFYPAVFLRMCFIMNCPIRRRYPRIRHSRRG